MSQGDNLSLRFTNQVWLLATVVTLLVIAVDFAAVDASVEDWKHQ